MEDLKDLIYRFLQEQKNGDGYGIERWILDQIELAAWKKDRNVTVTLCPDGTKTVSIYPIIDYQEEEEEE